MATISIRLPDDLTQALDEIATRRHSTRSMLIREAVARYCDAVRSEEKDDPFLLIEDEPSYTGSGCGDLAETSEVILREKIRGRRRSR